MARNGAYFQNDGPADHIPVNLDLVPNAVPQDEPLIKAANLPYSAMGMSFRPDTSNTPYKVRGTASWYGKQFHGRRTTSGERYDMFAMTAAHPTLPIPSYIRVTNLKNGKAVVVRINDRGPFHRGRILDLSYAAAHKLGFVGQGSAKVLIERVWPTVETASNPPAKPIDASLKQEDGPRYLQLGAFDQLSNAEALLKKLVDKLDTSYDPKLGIVNQKGTYMVRLGPFDSAAAVRNAAESLNVENIVMN
nr:septal ring lytic transglycosylase RlpA family protein [Paludibacterium purpuratum]